MQIYSINPFNYNKSLSTPAFEGRGKPIGLRYIVEKRSNLLPEIILEQASQIVARGKENMPSLKELHLKRYAPLLDMKSMDEVRQNYPEFVGIADSVSFERNGAFKNRFEEKTKGMNFPLKMLQELWGKLRTKDEVAQELGFKSRSSIEWALNQIGFVYFPHNYRTLVKSSDEAGNREIAQKTEAYNASHIEEMYTRNKHAAQFCKTPEYRAAQSARMKEHDIQNPERIEKIRKFNLRVNEVAPELGEAMSVFAQDESAFSRLVIQKSERGEKLSHIEERVHRAFW